MLYGSCIHVDCNMYRVMHESVWQVRAAGEGEGLTCAPIVMKLFQYGIFCLSTIVASYCPFFNYMLNMASSVALELKTISHSVVFYIAMMLI